MWVERDGLWAWRKPCGDVRVTDGDGPVRCERVKGHLGAHHGRGFWWSQWWEGATFVPVTATFTSNTTVTWEMR